MADSTEPSSTTLDRPPLFERGDFVPSLISGATAGGWASMGAHWLAWVFIVAACGFPVVLACLRVARHRDRCKDIESSNNPAAMVAWFRARDALTDTERTTFDRWLGDHPGPTDEDFASSPEVVQRLRPLLVAAWRAHHHVTPPEPTDQENADE